MKQHKPHIKELGCYKQVADVIGEVNAQKELWKVVHCEEVLNNQNSMESCYGWSEPLMNCFGWPSSPQGWDFWRLINTGVYPYER